MKKPRLKYSNNIPRDMAINPDEYYSVAQASSYLGKSRMSIYRYLASRSSSIAYQKLPGCFRKLIKGADLIAFKAEGLPKVGRRRNSSFNKNEKLSSINKEETPSNSPQSPNDTSN